MLSRLVMLLLSLFMLNKFIHTQGNKLGCSRSSGNFVLEAIFFSDHVIRYWLGILHEIVHREADGIRLVIFGSTLSRTNSNAGYLIGNGGCCVGYNDLI